MRTLRLFPFLSFFLLFANCNSSDELPIPQEPPAPKEQAIHIMVTEAGAGLPAAGVTIGLYGWYLIPYPSQVDAYYFIDSLGLTNSYGYFRWTNPDTAYLNSLHALGFSGNGYHAGPHIRLADSLSLHLPATLEGKVYPDGFLRFHITYDPTEVNEGVFFIFNVLPGYYGNYDPYNNILFQQSFSGAIDTTFTHTLKGHTTYNLYFAAYDGSDFVYFYPYSPFWDEERTVFCPARDTLDVEVGAGG